MKEVGTEEAEQALQQAKYRGAVGTAAVAGLFCLIVTGLLVVNNSRHRALKLLETSELKELKKALSLNPGDKTLKGRIRDLDLRVRREFFRQETFAENGAWLLLGGMAVLLLALRSSFALKKQPPIPSSHSLEESDEEKAASWSRWSIATTSVIALGAAVGLILNPNAGLTSEALKAWKEGKASPAPQQERPARTYPTWEEIVRQWPSFRGPGGSGVSAYTNVLQKWDGKSGEGILWKTEVPLPGNNSPVVWGKRIFLTGATKEKREIYCFDADTGQLRWRKPVQTIAGTSAAPPEVMDETGYAAPTAVTDGQSVFAIFANGDMAGYDVEGQRLWAVNLDKPVNGYGHAASLAMWKSRVFVQYDQGSIEEPDSKLFALDAQTGETAWEEYRPVTASWASPILVQTEAGPQLITCSNPLIIGYDVEGEGEQWSVELLSGDVGASPTFGNGLVFIASAYSKSAAIRPDGEGDVTTTHVVWTGEEGLPDTSSPLFDGQRLYLLAEGQLTCLNASDGKLLWEEYLEDNFTASPSLVGDVVYLLSEKGEMIFAKAGPEYKELGRAPLGEKCKASPAFAEGRIYIRSEKHLFCIGEK